MMATWFVSKLLLIGLRYAFPFEGNWNRISRRFLSWLGFLTWDTLSRLKGIETEWNLYGTLEASSLRYAFPFEGNWNQCSTGDTELCMLFLEIRFPVWREWKLYWWCCLDFPLAVLEIRFPVWRELKRNKVQEWSEYNNRTVLRYAFPFEGNWNLKGIVNYTLHLHSLEIRFPVWRELKQVRLSVPKVVRYHLEIRFPVWRELKRNVNIYRIILSLRSWDTLSRLKGIETCCF